MRLITIFLVLFISTSFQIPSNVLNTALPLSAIEIEKQGFNKLNSSLHYELNISYPFVHYKDKFDIEHKINIDIQSIMAFAISDFMKKMYHTKNEKGAIGLSFLNLDYKVHFQEYGVLSIAFAKETYYNGLEDIRNIKLTYNYDYINKRNIQLNDLFLPESDYKDRLFHLIKEKVGNSGKVKKDSYSIFCINKEGLLFPLDYNRCKGKNCPPEVLIKWSEIKDITSDFVRTMDLL
ncbi:hypothetical protein [Flammeovirga aprica]|uniref:DUF3298 domain-containing protein n=1 Tax=Flammeovirga aprica JL-4 TaxID=694437 RepID=A0A7X9XA46_9BACT|nr:hypothetical protein [Flammeovirga aprica]NME69268.1 hypothetical protein [Flammeovirga aprica JL-4]